MLFELVYGPELEAIYNYVRVAVDNVDREVIYRDFLGSSTSQDKKNTKTTDDAITFLKGVGLLSAEEPLSARELLAGDFIFTLIHSLQLINTTGKNLVGKQLQKRDTFFMKILSDLFIGQDIVFIADMHSRVNKYYQKDLNINEEQLNAWRRVMEYLGLGERHEKGFYCTISPRLVAKVLHYCISEKKIEAECQLDALLNDFFINFLPFAGQGGDISKLLLPALGRLISLGAINLKRMQDSPARPFWGENAFKWIQINEEVLKNVTAVS